MQYTELTLTVPEDFRTKLEEQAQKQYMTAEGLASCWLANQLRNATQGPMKAEAKPDLFLTVLSRAVPAALQALQEEMMGMTPQPGQAQQFQELWNLVSGMPLPPSDIAMLQGKVQELRDAVAGAQQAK